MSAQGIRTRNSCDRCHHRKVRCSKTTPRCDKCEAANAECVYSPRRARTRRTSYLNGNGLREAFADIFQRLERLEDHCNLEPNDNFSRSQYDATPGPSVDRGGDSLSHAESQSSASQILGWIMDPATRSQLSSNVFCHMRNAESRFFENEKCIEAMGAVVKDIERLFNTQTDQSPASPPIIPKEMARRWIQLYCDSFQFEAFQVPLKKDFLMAIPDLLEIPHVQLDYTSRIIYYNVVLHGIMMDSDYDSPKEGMIHYLYHACMELAEGWLSQIKNTPADLMVSFTLLAVALEGCNIELSWKILGHSCTIARAMGYFTVDGGPENSNGQSTPIENAVENEVDKNRKRFEFWYLLRTDCLFRLSFGKPALIQEGSWKVNFPDPTINGVDNASTRFLQIHFLASMRLTIVLLKYFDLVDTVPKPAPEVYDGTVGRLIAEVQGIMSDWNTEELLKTTTNYTDSSFCIDIMFQSYTMLIVLDYAKTWDENSVYLPRHTVDTSRKSLQMFQLMIGLTSLEHWGVSLILLHQFAPLFTLCLDIVEFPEREGNDADLALVGWFSDFVERSAKIRADLRPSMAMVKFLTSVCQRVKSGGH